MLSKWYFVPNMSLLVFLGMPKPLELTNDRKEIWWPRPIVPTFWSKAFTSNDYFIARAWKIPMICLLATKQIITKAMIHNKIEATLLDRILN